MFLGIVWQRVMCFHFFPGCAWLIARTGILLLVSPMFFPYPAAAGSREMVAQFFTAVQAVQTDGVQDLQSLAKALGKIPDSDTDWPVLMYLNGEAQRRSNDWAGARSTFRALAEWGANPPRNDDTQQSQWGGCGLCTVALWRWLQILDARGGEAEEIDQSLKIASELQRKPFFSGMVKGGLLPALPLIEEDIARRLAHIAWKDNRIKEATTLFLDFLSIDSTGVYEDMDKMIVEAIIKTGDATPDRLSLFRCRRQIYSLKTANRKQAAIDKLKRLWEDTAAPADVRAEAGYEWSAYYRRSVSRKQDVISVLNSVSDLSGGTGLISEKVLYLRAMVQNSVAPKNVEAFFLDMERLLKDFPNSRLADNALYQVAMEYLTSNPPDLQKALFYFQRLREFPYSNDKIDSAYFMAAIGLVDGGSAVELKQADELLSRYVESYPSGVFRHRCIFWRGRIAELTGRKDKARLLYEQLVDEAPYDYYGLRASMHLESGADAIALVLPRPGSKTLRKLREAYTGSEPLTELAGKTAFHERLRTAEHGGLYAELLSTVDGVGKRFRNRIDSIALDALESEGLIVPISLLLAFRQDAMAARDAVPTAENYLRLSGFFGKKLNDWPTAMATIFIREDSSRRNTIRLQNNKHFLPTMYPDMDDLPCLGNAIEENAWKIDDASGLSKSLMYAVIRHESGYLPGALSPVGAIGLFQIMPETFSGTKACWKLDGAAESPSPQSYLFNPARNIQFWSCWVQKEFKPYKSDDIALMLVRHHAGTGNLKKWMANWKGRTFEKDLEMQIDAYPFPATQQFVRHVLADITIARGIFEAPSAPGTEVRQ